VNDYIPITLPSKCLTYKNKDGSPVNPLEVSARTYQGSDEIYLAQINPLNLERYYFQVLKSIIRGIDPSQLTIGDRMYLILWEYINSYSKTMKIKSVCSHCFSEIEINVDLSKLETKELPDDYTQPQLITLPVSGEKLNLRLLTVEDEIKTEDFSKKNKQDALLFRYARTIVSEMDIVALMNKLSSMKAKDFMTIMNFQEKYDHGPVLKTTFTCPKEDCGEEDELDIPFQLDFFFPNVAEFGIFS